MQIKLNIGGIGFWIQYQGEMEIRGTLRKYVSEIKKDVEVLIVSKQGITVPDLICRGEDLFCRFYGEQDHMQIEAKGRDGEPSAMIFCEEEMRLIRCEIYPQMQNVQQSLNGVISLLPMRQILYCFQAFILHSSRIEVDGKAILFSGSSGVGKTTQARLWKKYRNAPHLCNDRTIIREENGQWNTYGYYEDGSEPIADNKCLPLGAIVLLKQDTKNCIYRVHVKESLRVLMEQIFLDHWDLTMINHTLERVMHMLDEIPVYCLHCMPDKTAVSCLEGKLLEEGVMK